MAENLVETEWWVLLLPQEWWADQEGDSVLIGDQDDVLRLGLNREEEYH